MAKIIRIWPSFVEKEEGVLFLYADKEKMEEKKGRGGRDDINYNTFRFADRITDENWQ